MPRKQPKTAVVAFKVESDLAEFLNRLPNKSAFIRKAIASQMKTACPLCNGIGVVSRNMHDQYASILKKWKCEGCGSTMPLPRDPGELEAEDRARLEQFFNGGPLYCDPCYGKAATCGDCGWHIAEDNVNEHQRQVHHAH